MVSVTYSCQAATRCPACRYVTDECVTELLRLIGQVEAVRTAQRNSPYGSARHWRGSLCSLLALLLLALLLPLTSPTLMSLLLATFCLCTLVSAAFSICYILG